MTVFEQAWDKLQDIVTYWNTLDKEERPYDPGVEKKADDLFAYLLDNCSFDTNRTEEFAVEMVSYLQKELNREDLETASPDILPVLFFRIMSYNDGYDIWFNTLKAPNVRLCIERYAEVINRAYDLNQG